MAQKTILQIEGLSSEALFKEFSKIIDARFLKVEQPKTDEGIFITRQNVADMLHVTLPTVHSWTNSGVNSTQIDPRSPFQIDPLKMTSKRP